jgi:ABC-type branched-subunit amino acid transport system ATPase component
MKLELQDIRLTFSNSRKGDFHLLQGVNLAVSEGEITAIVGGNGTGKTTLFNIISGFITDYQGKVLIDGKDIRPLPTYKRAQAGIGRLFQGTQLMGNLTLMENMKMASVDTMGEHPISPFTAWKSIRTHEYQKEQRAIDIINKLFGSDSKYLSMLDQKASALSYGEQRLIGIARLLMGESKILLLDEPTSGVNPVYIKTIADIIRKLVEEQHMTVLLIEHNMNFVKSLATNCAYLDNGKIMQYGPTEQVLNDEGVKNSYLGV